MRSAPLRRSCILLAAALVVPAVAARAAESESIRDRTIVLRDVSAGPALPPDMTTPESRTRWDLTSLPAAGARTLRVLEAGPGIVIEQASWSGAPADTRYTATIDDGSAVRWLFPDREMLRPGSVERIDLLALTGSTEDRLVIDLETVGSGWVHLPSGPREAALQRALVYRTAAGTHALVPEALVHRWVDPRAGVIAFISGPPDAAGRERTSVDRAWVLDSIASGEALSKIYVNQIEDIPFSGVNYGWDRGSGTTIASLEPNAYANIGALIAANSWNFSGNNTGAEVAATNTTVTSAETCNATRCGYTVAGGVLGREDKNVGLPSLDKINSVTTKQINATDTTLWLRAGALHEGKSGALGTGESRFCYITDGTGTRTQVPLWKLGHQDAGGFYMQPGDTWTSGVFNCEQNLFNEVCGGGGTFSKLYTKNATCGGSARSGTQSGSVIKAGVVTTPSGHTFNTLLARTVTEFCVYLDSTCLFAVDSVRTAVYLWQVPYIGTVVRLQSIQDVPNITTFTTVQETDFKFGLFPPRTITAPSSTNTTVSLSWDPGLDTHRISGYKIYWDTDSGGATPYAFNSVTNAGQVTFAGTTATISGLAPSTNYFFTVTARSNFTDPSSLVTTTYESLLYPTQVFGDPGFIYPIEVQKATTGAGCTPTQQVNNLHIAPPTGTAPFSWNASSDPCLTGYRILRASSPVSAAGWTTLADVGLVTTWTGSPAPGYFLVIARGATGTGPWGHYNQ